MNDDEPAATSTTTAPLSETAFRRAEKKYKLFKPSRQGNRKIEPPETDFSDVLDFSNFGNNTDSNRAKIKVLQIPVRDGGDGTTTTTVTAMTFDALPGFVVLPGFLSVEQQRYWISRSMTEFTAPPYPNNETNLLPGEEKRKLFEGAAAAAATASSSSSSSLCAAAATATAATSPSCDAPTTSSSSSPSLSPALTQLKTGGYRPSLRWATLGYSYNWTERTYKISERAPFPPNLAALVQNNIVRDVFSKTTATNAESAKDFEAQTAIVNFFPVGSQMCAHQDVSEAAMNRPLVSMSFGCSAVFLMGTTSRDDAPHAMWLRSGDVAIFAGATRDAYHAVPRIMDDCPRHLLADDGCAALPGVRVNINVRQVFDAEHGPEALPGAVACAKNQQRE